MTSLHLAVMICAVLLFMKSEFLGNECFRDQVTFIVPRLRFKGRSGFKID